MTTKRTRPSPIAAAALPTDRVAARGPPAEALMIVGIGTSAGGLDAARRLLDVLPATSGMAFVIVQHLDPNHASLLVDLLATHTTMPVVEATEGAAVEANKVFVIPPGKFLAVAAEHLHLTTPTAPHGARLPIDFLFESLADDIGKRAACIILSGTGTDGTRGARAISAAGGLVIAQDPAEAAYDGMIRSAMASGSVDRVVPVAEMPAALNRHATKPDDLAPDRPATLEAANPGQSETMPSDWLRQIIDLIRARTAHDFTLYKPGTLQRRIERRMALAGLKATERATYLARLTEDASEVDVLATDLLINVTSFFRDKAVYEYLSEHVIPDVLKRNTDDHPIRLWIAGCSSGEEAYSMAIVFREQIAATSPGLRLQIFASDVDPDAIMAARDGHYPAAIASDIGPERLARNFIKEDGGYRIIPDLRAAIVFSVHDILSNPPFSRLDLISCRNLLIYLGPEAQGKAIGLFHFGLKKGGILVLGTAETVGDSEDTFAVLSKPARIYRHIGPSSRLILTPSLGAPETGKTATRLPKSPVPIRASNLADMARQRVLDAFAPPSVLVDSKNACVFTLGAANPHLKVPTGYPTQDLYAMTDPALHPRFRLAIQRAHDEATRVMLPAFRFDRAGEPWLLTLSAEPVAFESETLTLISFVESRAEKRQTAGSESPPSRVAELELELENARSDLAEAIHNLHVSGEEQKAINEETLSVNEEYQSTNEELLASKEELQSVNEELTALNAQLQETLDRQRTTSNDLQNVLYSTDVATLFLDTKLRIRFFTPSTRSLFNVIANDVGRPLADLNALAIDDTFLADANAVLADHAPKEREIAALSGAWYIRRILPYRTHCDGVEGVVVTFTDVSERKRIADALGVAKRQAQKADAAKSRFLAAASHDLRQPLQTLSLIQGLLARTVQGEKAERLVARLEDTLMSMAAMLNTLLDINQIEAGTVSADITSFPVDALLTRLRDEFAYTAEAKGLKFRVVPSSLMILSDPRLIEQMIRNIVSNALKYTKHGTVLLGCRRSAGRVFIQVWDNGQGIPESELQSIFEEYHQIGNPARERANGLGLGLAIVKRLGELLGHAVTVRSQLGKGSMFAIEIREPDGKHHVVERRDPPLPLQMREDRQAQSGTILVIEDGPDIRMLLEALLTADGYRVVVAGDGVEALDLITRRTIRPDLILADFNLPNGMNGLQIAAQARHLLARQLPVIILSGDISAGTLSDIAAAGCVQLAKPVKLGDMRTAIEQQMAIGRTARAQQPKPVPAQPPMSVGPRVVIVDDDDALRQALRDLLEADGRTVADYASCESFLSDFRPGQEACLLIDASLPGMSGIELLRHLQTQGHLLPAIMITGNGDVAIAVEAMKCGAMDFLEKPIGAAALKTAVDRAMVSASDGRERSEQRESAAAHVAGLTPRQHQIMDMILAGHPNKNIAADLGISQRTVENHRAAIMKRTGSSSLPDLARMVVAADMPAGDKPAGK